MSKLNELINLLRKLKTENFNRKKSFDDFRILFIPVFRHVVISYYTILLLMLFGIVCLNKCFDLIHTPLLSSAPPLTTVS